MASTTRRERKQATRSAILRVAAQGFAARGYLGTPISDLADTLGLTKGAVYFHFPSKAQLAAEIVGEFVAGCECMLAEVDRGELIGLDALRDVSGRFAVWYRDEVSVRAAVRLLREAALIETELPMPLVAWTQAVRGHLDQAAQAGQLHLEVDTDELAWCVVASLAGAREIADRLDQRDELPARIEKLWGSLASGAFSAQTTSA